MRCRQCGPGTARGSRGDGVRRGLGSGSRGRTATPFGRGGFAHARAAGVPTGRGRIEQRGISALGTSLSGWSGTGIRGKQLAGCAGAHRGGFSGDAAPDCETSEGASRPRADMRRSEGPAAEGGRVAVSPRAGFDLPGRGGYVPPEEIEWRSAVSLRAGRPWNRSAAARVASASPIPQARRTGNQRASDTDGPKTRPALPR